MIEWFLIYAMKVGRETGHIVFMSFLNLGKTRGVQYLSGFCTSVSSPTLMLFYPLGDFSQTWERGKNLKDNSFSVNTLKFSEWLEGDTPTWWEVGWKSVIACSAHLPFWPTRQDKHSNSLAQHGTFLGHWHYQRRWEAAKDWSSVTERGI